MHGRGSGIVHSVVASSFLVLAGCGGSGAPTGDATGLFSLGISDGPVHSAEKVCITFDSIEFKQAGDAQAFTVDLEPPEKINLLEYQGANAAPLLENEELPAGDYEWVRLGVDASMGSNGGAGDTGGDECDGEASYLVMEGGAVHNVFVPSGEQTGLKLVQGFTVPVNGSIDVTADWDLMQSVTAPPGLAPDVVLKPTIRLVNNVDAGTLAGVVAEELAGAAGCDPSVFLFDDGVTPNAVAEEGNDPDDPVATAMVHEQANSDGTRTFHYEIGFLLAGSYEAAFTCDGSSFEPAAGKPADIGAQQVTTVDFP